ncbi:hypothetical protein CHUAL_001605 [Chamberlinius hualienensis]
MGSCFGRCCPEFFGGANSRSWFSGYYDRGSLVEFESLMETTVHHDEPISNELLTAREKLLVSMRCYEELVKEQQMLDEAIAREHAKREEELELEEGALIEGRREAARVARLANSHQIINPARLVLRDSTSSWVTTDEPDINGADDVETEVFIDENKLRLLTSRTYLPMTLIGYSNSILETGSTVSSNVSGSRDWVNNNGSTPPSSIDLEWDEAGVFLPTDVNGDHVKHETPTSNDLEWDNDAVNVETSPRQPPELDLETEQLISEIEKLTAEALADTDHGYR